MKKKYSYLLGCLLVLLGGSCSTDETIMPDQPETSTESVVLKYRAMDAPAAEGRSASVGVEDDVHHLDVLVFDAREQCVHHERVTNCTERQGTVVLSKSKKDFQPQTGYKMYLIANSQLPAEKFDPQALRDLTTLNTFQQEDMRIFLTGLTEITGVEVPKAFLMDGIAYAGATEPAVPDAVVLNDGKQDRNTELKVTLRRAAAKITVHIRKGDKVRFDNETAGRGYYLANLPYTTSVLAGVDAEAKLRMTQMSDTRYFEWSEQAVEVKAYAYAHNWQTGSSFEKEVRLVVNIPLYFKQTPDAEEKRYTASYYQIPVSNNKRLLRNTHYDVTVTLNAPGGTDPRKPVLLENIQYQVRSWDDIAVHVGDESEKPIYLTVNKEEMEMRNVATDHTTLSFASSSDVEVKVDEVYYYDKFSQKKNEKPSVVTVTPDPGLNGHLKIDAPVPTNNTIRYIQLTVTNKDGATPRKVIIRQYPLEYITNIKGWYSYRSDFGGTTWELLKGQDVKGKTYRKSQKPGVDDAWVGCDWSNNRWSYKTYAYKEREYTAFFGSKVAEDAGGGKSNIYYYRWNEKRSSRWPYSYSYTVKHTAQVSGLDNARMYHVRIIASSGKYTVGTPRITDGKTDPGADNAKLVSPSFMIASQLGAVLTADNVDIAARHAKEYVEVYKDENGNTVHLDDWRLPTEAEIKIIVDFQQTSDAMDVVLSGRTYWSASGEVNTGLGDDVDTKRIRCVRDVYQQPKP